MLFCVEEAGWQWQWIGGWWRRGKRRETCFSWCCWIWWVSWSEASPWETTHICLWRGENGTANMSGISAQNPEAV